MILKIVEIEGATRRVAEDQPQYETLPIKDHEELIAGGVVSNVMTSEWKPTQRQVDELRKGGTIQLHILGTVHPPVMIEVVPKTG